MMDELKIDWLIVNQCPVMNDPNVRHYYGTGKVFKHVICSEEAENQFMELLTCVMKGTSEQVCEAIRTVSDNPVSVAYRRLVTDYTFEPFIQALTPPLPPIISIILAERSKCIVRGLPPIYEREGVEETRRDYVKEIKETCLTWEDGSFIDVVAETFRLKYPDVFDDVDRVSCD